jgi:predicted AlkP superfamily phosphohydrolase/phosphomutase
VTYPPRPVNGLLIGCFLATDVLKCAYPKELGAELQQWGYRIDADANLGRKDKEAFFADLNLTLDKRWEAARRLFEREEWDFFQLHVMETDRINHFLWEQYAKQDSAYYRRFLDFYRRVDELLGEFYDRAEKSAEFIVLSDHGFCSVKKEVYLNQWLEESGWLHLDGEKPKSMMDMSAKSRAYSLIPGRIFLNLAGREQKGRVNPGREAEGIKAEITKALLDLKDPETGQPIVQRVYSREELYSGPYFEEAADLFAIPYDGYDLKANVRQPNFTFKGDLVGMHTFDDAALYIKDQRLADGEFSIMDVAPSLLKMLDVEDPVGMDGRSLI